MSVLYIRGADGKFEPVLSLRGEAGPAGEAGPQGIQGDQGPKGDTGPTGPTGPVGPEGPRGADGPKGDTGATGPVGPEGKVGPTGPQGEDGFSPTVSVTQITGGHRVTITDKEGPKSFTVADGKDGTGGSGGGTGADGEDGGYYTPTVSDAGVLSWEASKADMPQVASVSIKGPQGDKGDTGAAGPAGADGAKGDKGEKGDKGDTGATGPAGNDGQDGTSVTVVSVNMSSADGGDNVVTFSDGRTLTVKNGSKGSKGDKGDQGDEGPTGPEGPKGPIGPAYNLTEADKNTIAEAVAETSAPVNHASTDATYGMAAEEQFGHVRLVPSILEGTDNGGYVAPDGEIVTLDNPRGYAASAAALSFLAELFIAISSSFDASVAALTAQLEAVGNKQTALEARVDALIDAEEVEF